MALLLSHHIQTGNVDQLYLALRKGANPNDTSPLLLNTPVLHGAGGANPCDMIVILVAFGAHVNAIDNDGSTALHIATEVGRDACTRVLIALGANIDHRNFKGRTPLHLASKDGHVEVVATLLFLGANAHAQDYYGETPAMLAQQKGRAAVVGVLKVAGAAVAEDYRASHFQVSGVKLGCGGDGDVYMGYDDNWKREVAVKVNQTDSLQEHRERLFQESELLKTLQHPNIVSYVFYHFDATTSPGQHQIFMECMPHGSVAKALRVHGAMWEHLVQKYFKDALMGLAYLHAHGVLHRDIKPSNMLLRDNGDEYITQIRAQHGHMDDAFVAKLKVGEFRPFTEFMSLKLADFGCSVASSNGAGGPTTIIPKGEMRGTIRYLAPELIYGRQSEASDIWALACSIVEMATDSLPWCDVPDQKDVIHHIIASKSHPEIPGHLSAELKGILTTMFARNPRARPSAQSILKNPYFNMEVNCTAPPKKKSGSTIVIEELSSSRYSYQSESSILFHKMDLEEGGPEVAAAPEIVPGQGAAQTKPKEEEAPDTQSGSVHCSFVSGDFGSEEDTSMSPRTGDGVVPPAEANNLFVFAPEAAAPKPLQVPGDVAPPGETESVPFDYEAAESP